MKINFRKIYVPLVVSLFVLGGLFASPQKTQAAFWPAMDPIMKRMLDTVYETVMGMMRGSLKQGAVSMLSSQMDSFMGGNGSGSAAYITNWQDYLVNQPKNDTKAYMNDYISQMTSGRGSLTGYQAEGFSGGGGYYAAMSQSAKSMVEQKDATPSPTYEGNPSDMFASGTAKNFNEYFSGVNNPWAFNMAVDAEYEKTLAENKLARQSESEANQGFVGTKDSSGNVTYPGILAKEMTANVQDLPNKITASATSVPEIISSVMAQTISKSMSQGFSSVQKSFQGQANTENKTNSSLDSLMGQEGPGARFDVPTGF